MVSTATKVAAISCTTCVVGGAIVRNVGVAREIKSDEGVAMGAGIAVCTPPTPPPLPPTTVITMVIAAISATPAPPNNNPLGNPPLAYGGRGATTARTAAPQ